MGTKPIFILVFLLIGFSSEVYSSQPEPGPPSSNPHAPVTDQDKKRVAFAEKAIIKMLKTSLQGSEVLKDFKDHHDSHSYNVNEKCLDDEKCVSAETELVKYLNTIKTKYGRAYEIRHAHIIPWSWEKFEKDRRQNAASSPVTQNKIQDSSNVVTERNKSASLTRKMFDSTEPPLTQPVPQKKDEFMIHVYVNFDRAGWKNVDVFVAEDENGNLTFRRFFIMDLYMPHTSYPEGTVC